MSAQSDAIARIALAIEFDLSDTRKTTRSILLALNKAYDAGFAHGVEVSAKHQSQVLDLVCNIIDGQRGV
jgi:hypothetical protein